MENFMQKKFNAKVLNFEILAKGVKKITIKVNENFSFLPWQYIWIEIPNMKIEDAHGNRRAFSIFNNISADNTIEIIARISESGYKQSLFALEAGDDVIVHGPFGDSFIVSEDHLPNHIVMIAGGIGIAAFLQLVETISKRKFKTKCFLVYLNNSPESTPFIEELKLLKKKNKFFDYVISYENFSWNNVSKISSEFSSGEWWIAGPQGMVDFVYTELEIGGISKSNMFFENFYPTPKNNLTPEEVKRQLKENNIFAEAIQNSTNHTVITDANGVVLFANKATENITGYSHQEILGNTPRLWGGMMNQNFYVNFWKQKLSGEAFQGEIINRRKNGEIYYAIAHIAPILDKEKNIRGYIGTEEDISNLKIIEKEIMEKSAELDAFFNTAIDLMCVANTDKYFKRINPKFMSILGFTEEELLKNTFLSFIHPDDIAETEKIIGKLSQGEKTVDFKNRFRTKSGSYVWLQWNVSPQGSSLFAVGRDITVEIENSRKMEEINTELRQINKYMIDRELKMIELKEEIAKLKNNE